MVPSVITHHKFANACIDYLTNGAQRVTENLPNPVTNKLLNRDDYDTTSSGLNFKLLSVKSSFAKNVINKMNVNKSNEIARLAVIP